MISFKKDDTLSKFTKQILQLMKKFLLWIPTIPFMLGFGSILVVFHVLQVIALKLGYKAHNAVVNGMIFFLNLNLCWLLSPVKFTNLAGKLPKNKATIIISNHQSMFDIPAIGYLLKKQHPKFISKKSLAYGIPSVSYNIRNGGSIYFERPKREDSETVKARKRAEAINKLNNFTIYLNEHKRGGVIFPEGTRSKNGHLSEFKKQGLLNMLEKMPDATIIPVALDGFWRLTQYNLKPMGCWINLSCTVLPIIERANKSHEDIIDEAWQTINNHVFDKVD